jgi:hypothetical protein
LRPEVEEEGDVAFMGPTYQRAEEKERITPWEVA